MNYKDLVYKITSSGNDRNVIKEPEELKRETQEVNAAKKALILKDVLIGVMVGADIVLNKGIAEALKAEIERTLTVLFNSPISDTFSFLPFDKATLIPMLELFPGKNHHFVYKSEEAEEIKELKKTKMNLSTVYLSDDVNKAFVGKIDYLMTVNIDKLEPSMEAKLKEKNIMIFPMVFRGTKQFSQAEKLVAADPSGWGYNSASGIWLKTWGNDGSQEVPSWKAPADWNMEAEPKYVVF